MMSSKKSHISAATRTRILESTLELLESGGARSVRMADIAKAAGISRQALYLHFPNRAELLIGATLHLNAVKDIDARLAPSRTAQSGTERLDAYIEAWGGFIPEIYGIARALIAMSDDDPVADATWRERMQDMREGCEAAIEALDRDGMLTLAFTREQATDLLWTMLSVGSWEKLTVDCGWSQSDYIRSLKHAARRIFVNERALR